MGYLLSVFDVFDLFFERNEIIDLLGEILFVIFLLISYFVLIKYLI